MTCVVHVPIVNREPALFGEPAVQRSAWIRGEDMKCGGFDPMLDGPFDRSLEDRSVVAIHAEDEAAVDHHAEVVKTTNRGSIVTTQILILPLLCEFHRVQ